MAGDQQLQQMWAEIQQRLRASCPDSVYETWLARLEPAAIESGSLYLKTPDESREWVRRRFGPSIESAARKVDPRVERIELIETDEGIRPVPAPPGSLQRSSRGSRFKPTYTFDRFVIGESNRFAHAAALAVAEIPGHSYNPLFVHGPPGVGKTHLLQAIGNYTALHDTSLAVHYVTVEAFTNEFMRALQHNDLPAFKATYRQVDLLVVDDVQFLEGKLKTAEEFFYTLDSLLAGGGQAVLSSDSYPSEIAALDPRLRERFQSGLIVDLQPPDLETRLAILGKLASANPSSVDPAVLEHMATRVSSNVRVLEGAFIRVVAFASLVEQEITAELTDRVLSHLYRSETAGRLPERPAAAIPHIQRETAALFDLDTHTLCSPSRRRGVVYARQVAMYLSRELTTQSLPSIGREFGGRDHTTVLHAHRKIARQVLLDASTRSLVLKLTTAIQDNSQVNPQPLHPESPST